MDRNEMKRELVKEIKSEIRAELEKEVERVRAARKQTESDAIYFQRVGELRGLSTALEMVKG